MSAFHPSRLCLCEHFPLPQANELSISARCDLLQPFRPVAFQEETQLNKKPLTTGFRPQCLGKEPHRKWKTGWKMTCSVGRGKLSCQALHSVCSLIHRGHQDPHSHPLGSSTTLGEPAGPKGSGSNLTPAGAEASPSFPPPGPQCPRNKRALLPKSVSER